MSLNAIDDIPNMLKFPIIESINLNV